MKDRDDYERMRAAASPEPPNGPSGEVSVTLDCRRCGEAARALDETCPRCAAPIERLPSFWWCALPVGAAAVRVRRADLNRVPRAARAGAPPRKPASDRETLVVIERTGRLTRWGFSIFDLLWLLSLSTVLSNSLVILCFQLIVTDVPNHPGFLCLVIPDMQIEQVYWQALILAR